MSELLNLASVSKSFPARRNVLGRTLAWNHAVRNVSFSLRAGTTLALVGESGSGKTTVARLVLRLVEPSDGIIHFEGSDISLLRGSVERAWRRQTSMVFQDPYTSLDPKLGVGQSVTEPLLVHRLLPRSRLRERAVELFESVGLPPDAIDRHPHEFSGGQLQRIAIARAISAGPKLVVCDEPVAALDVSIRAQVVNLLRDLQHRLGIAYLFISHDLSLVRAIAHDVAVMCRGELVEAGSTDEVFSRPRHAYTKALLEAIPRMTPRTERRAAFGQSTAPGRSDQEASADG